MKRLISFLEVCIFYGLLIVYIWTCQTTFPLLALLLVLGAILSLVIRNRDSFDLGFHLSPCPVESIIIIGGIFFFLWLVIFALGGITNPAFLQQPNLEKTFAVDVSWYFPKALGQQVCLNLFFANRIEEAALGRKKIAACCAGALFAIVHWPSPVLVIATLLGGSISAYFFLRLKNLNIIIFLSLIHALLAISIMYFLPEKLHHGLRIGPGF